MYNDDYKGNIVVHKKVKPKNKKNDFSLSHDKKYIFLALIIIIPIAVFLAYNKGIIGNNSIAYLENDLINKAREYLVTNYYNSDNEIFIEASKLGAALPKGCNMFLSGVFVKNNEYEPYLWCDNYHTQLYDNSNDYVALNGNDVIFMPLGMTYSEASYVDNNKSLGIKVITKGTVGSELGVYNIDYNVMRYNSVVKTLHRKVVIVDNQVIRQMYPTIKLKGDEIVYLNFGEKYNELGVVASDSTDGVYTSEQILINSNVDTSRPSEYRVVYTIVNSQGFASSITRRVLVANPEEDIAVAYMISPSTLTNQDVVIMVSSFGSNYSYTILPDNTRNDNPTIKYTVKNNGTYVFQIYDKDNNITMKSIVVDNIDKTKPSGDCKALVYEKYTDISVTANSNNGISSYNYVVNGQSSGYLTSKTYRMNVQNASNVSVYVKDTIGNEQTLVCNVSVVDPTIGNNKVTYITKYNHEYVVINNKVSVEKFVNIVSSNHIAQNGDETLYGTSCLSFAQYYACQIDKGNISTLNLYDAGNYHSGCTLVTHESPNMQDILKIIFDEINQGRPVVIKVNSNPERTRRHFLTVVGYRRGIYSGSLLKDTDLLAIDAWDGIIRNNSEDTAYAKRRTLWPQKGQYYVATVK